MINSSIFDNIKIESVKFMEIKENKEKKKLIILIGVLFAIIIGLLIGLIFIINNSKKLNKTNQSSSTINNEATTITTTTKPSTNSNETIKSPTAEAYFLNLCASSNCEEYNLTKAKELISKYRIENDLIYDENTMVAKKAKGTLVECNKVFSENNREVNCPENNKVKSIKYEDFILKKKELYGPNATMPKEKFDYENCGIYQYVKETDSFVFSGYKGCGAPSLVSNDILQAYELNNKLYIYGFEYISDVGDIVQSLSEKIYIFNKINGNFYLEKFERI